MIVSILLVVSGLTLVVLGADWLVDGASGIARKAGVSEFVIGLTIVGFGTSCPELVVSLAGAISGNSDVAIGNVIGSNIFNSLLILGLTSVLAPIGITSANKRRDIPIALGVTLLLCLTGKSQSLIGIGSDSISRLSGVVYLALFALYMYSCFKFDTPGSEPQDMARAPLGKSIFLTVLGLVGLVFGGKLFVNSSVDIAHSLGISDKFIAITLLAGGTSLPELVTCIVAVFKNKNQLALGNILGSNVFNILLILGVSAIVRPIDLFNINMVDIAVLMLSALLIFTSAFTGRKNVIDRFDGILMLLAEAAYITWLFISL